MNSNIQQKLFNYSETPPSSAWDSIAAALDEKPVYAQKLYQYEQAPPAGVWNNVAAQIVLPETKVVPLRAKVFKYAIAAAVLGLIAAGSIFYLKNGAGSNLASQPQNAVSTGVNDSASDTQTSSKQATFGDPDDVGIKTDEDVSAGIATVSKQALVRFSPHGRLAKDGMPAHAIDITPEVKTRIDTELADRYMIATTSAGKVVRLPKKAYSDYACAETYKNYQCKEKIASLQSKMAASVATDFTEFMDLLKKLQDNQ